MKEDANMRKAFWAVLAALPLAIVGGLVYGRTEPKSGGEAAAEEAGAFTCPLTGEELACPSCCPLNK